MSFSPRKARTALYLSGGLDEYNDLLARLGQYKTGKGCLYLRRVDDVDREVLREIVVRSQRLARPVTVAADPSAVGSPGRRRLASNQASCEVELCFQHVAALGAVQLPRRQGTVLANHLRAGKAASMRVRTSSSSSGSTANDVRSRS